MDGIHSLMPRCQMTLSARKLRDAYARIPEAPFVHYGDWYYCMDEWKQQGMPQDVDQRELFLFEPPGGYDLFGLGWCEANFVPAFEEVIVEDRGEYEVVQDFAGRKVLCFKGRRSGFMPEYLDHPVKDLATWERSVAWRMDPTCAARYADLEARMASAIAAAGEGRMISQRLVGSYMYLRSLIGPEELLFAFHDQPELIHACMRQWLALADAVTAAHQKYVTFDEVFLAEDICYNHGPLVGPDMMKEFLLPYEQQLLANIRRRQIDQQRHLYVQIDTDGDCRPTIELYTQALGMDVMSPFEVASGCDVVEIGRQYPHLVIRGGIDKRVLARSRGEIDAYLERILPAMRRRGGYIPAIDHGVPAEVPYENYLHYRRRCVEHGGTILASVTQPA